MTVRAGGVTFRHATRMPLRKANATAATTRHNWTASVAGTLTPGTMSRRITSTTEPVNDQRRIEETSSDVRWRSLRWSRS